jgi:hypothetical protein
MNTTVLRNNLGYIKEKLQEKSVYTTPWQWRQQTHVKRRLTSARLHGKTNQKLVAFRIYRE